LRNMKLALDKVIDLVYNGIVMDNLKLIKLLPYV